MAEVYASQSRIRLKIFLISGLFGWHDPLQGRSPTRHAWLFDLFRFGIRQWLIEFINGDAPPHSVVAPANELLKEGVVFAGQASYASFQQTNTFQGLFQLDGAARSCFPFLASRKILGMILRSLYSRVPEHGGFGVLVAYLNL